MIWGHWRRRCHAIEPGWSETLGRKMKANRPIGLLAVAALGVLGALTLAASASAQIGAPLTNLYAVTPSGERVTLWEFWYVVPYWQTGNYRFPIQRYRYYLDSEENQVLHGIHSFGYLNGKAVEFTTYAHGLKDGPFETLGPTFKLQARGNYRGGDLDGEVTWFYESGAVRRLEHYAGGVLDGTFRAFHEGGGPEEESVFVAGLRQGPVTWYHPNGQVAGLGTYIDNFLSGPLALYDDEGRKRAGGTLEEEWIVGAWQCFAPDGSLEAERLDCEDQHYDRCECR